MHATQEMTLVRSSFLKSWKEGQNFKIAHVISGRQFAVDAATIEVLDYFKEPQNIKKEELSPNLNSSIDFMINKGLLISSEEAAKDTFYTTLSNQPLFGFAPYEEKNKESQVVFVGVPYGSGNPASDATGKFPFVLRRFLHAHNMSLTPTSKPNYHFLGNDARVHQLEYLIKQQKVRDAGDIFIHHYESKKEVYQKINFLFERIIDNNKVTFGIGGDHSVSYPIISSLANRYPKFNVLHFDAHTDVYTSNYQSILDNNGLHHHGNFVTKCLEMENIQHYYQFGIRGINNAFHIDNHPKLKVYWADQLKSLLRTDKTIDLPEDEYYYITFDIDVLDPSIAPGTATPIPGGFYFDEILALFNRLDLKNKNIIGIDFVEVNKEKDPESVTTALSAQIILNLLNFLNVS